MRNRFGFLLGVLILISGPPSFAGIGRVGNSSIGSDHEGFETVLPEQFPITRQRRVQLQMRSLVRHNSGRFSQILVSPVRHVFAREFPDLRNWSREDWLSKFENVSEYQDWFEPPSNTCVVATRYLSENNEVIGLATWGMGRGVVFSGRANPISWQAVGEMLIGVQLDSEGCQW